jgi:hypothetical protein
VAKKYPVLYTILVWIGIVAFGLTTFCGMYVLSFLPEIPASEVEERQMLIETGAMIAALGAASLIFLGMSLWRNRGMATVFLRRSPRPSSIDPR